MSSSVGQFFLVTLRHQVLRMVSMRLEMNVLFFICTFVNILLLLLLYFITVTLISRLQHKLQVFIVFQPFILIMSQSDDSALLWQVAIWVLETRRAENKWSIQCFWHYLPVSSIFLPGQAPTTIQENVISTSKTTYNGPKDKGTTLFFKFITSSDNSKPSGPTYVVGIYL